MYRAPCHLPAIVQDALSQAEDFIRGFEGYETQEGKPEEILEAIACARLPWKEPPHPGSAMLEQYLTKGEDFGLVQVQQWCPGGKMRVGSFLPGRQHWCEGDTPKTVPERDTWCETREKAGQQFEQYVNDAIRDGWLLKEEN